MSTLKKLVFVAFVCTVSGQELNTSCPNVLKYLSNNTHNWAALLTLENKIDLEGLFVEISMDKPVDVFNNWFGLAKTKDNRVYILEAPERVLPRNAVSYIRFSVNFTGQTPRIIAIRMNGRLVCPRANRQRPTVFLPLSQQEFF